ncbi:MAG: lasso peptide isopeptide bond-forming cyclase [Rivularia sp. (in: cyanobacteria)]
MSGIVGIHYLDERPVDRENLTKMVDILAHRGPDGADIWVDGCVGFGHRMLWTTPESLIEKLPLENQRGDLVITADARIDNRDELIAALQINNRPSDKVVDSELILAAYEKWGEDCPKHLLGDFAFAIWDKRKQVLFCARDPMGVKPFYYYRSDKIFVFASEIKALLCLAEVPYKINELGIGLYLIGISEDEEITFYQDIRRLPKAHSLVINSQSNQLQRYWRLDPSRELKLSSNQEYAEAYREILTEAVRCRLRSAFPVGSMLSGGLDSSSIACIASELLKEEGNHKLHTFSGIFPNLSKEQRKFIDERCYVDLVVAKGGILPHYVEADRLSPLTDYDKVIWHMDEGFSAPNLYMHWALYKTANQQNVRIILDGIDGDSTISHGQAYLSDLVRTFRLKTFLKQAKAYASRFNLPLMQVLWEWGLLSVVPESFWKLQHRRKLNNKTLVAETVIKPAFAQRLKISEKVEDIFAKNSQIPMWTARQIHFHSLNSGLLQSALELADKAASAFSVSPSYPFCDRRLMEFCLAIPPEQKFSNGWTRLIARRALAGILPDALQTRICKANLGASSKPKLLEYEQDTLQELIFNKSHLLEDYIDVNNLHQTYYRYASEPMKEQEAMTIFNAIGLSLWLEKQV